jgi:hypothetical protein
MVYGGISGMGCVVFLILSLIGKERGVLIMSLLDCHRLKVVLITSPSRGIYEVRAVVTILGFQLIIYILVSFLSLLAHFQPLPASGGV